MRQATDQQRVIKGELRQARDLLVAEFLCEISSDNGDIETGTPRLVRLNISKYYQLCHHLVFTLFK